MLGSYEALAILGRDNSETHTLRAIILEGAELPSNSSRAMLAAFTFVHSLRVSPGCEDAMRSVRAAAMVQS